MTPTLAEVLSEYRTRTRHAGRGDLVFPTAAGRRDNPSNVRNRFLADSVKLANAKLAECGGEPIGKVTLHSAATDVRLAAARSQGGRAYVMAQLGHTNPKMTLGVYGQVIASNTDHGAARLTS